MTRPDPKEFQAFATAVGRRFGDRVGVWSIWNEPNHPEFLRPQFEHKRATSPRIYRKLFLAGRRGLRASGNGADTLLFGETAPRGTPRVVAPLAFLRGALCLDRRYHRRGRCARVETGGYAHHAYTTRVGPRFRPPDRDDVTIGVLSRLTHALDRAGRAGAIPRGLGIYLTEFGIQSTPDPFVGVSLARQAEYLGIAEHMAYVNPRVKSFSQYLLDDDRPRKGRRVDRYSGFESGLRRSDGRAKPAYDAFRLPLAAEAYGRSDVLWGRVRPLAARTQVTILVSPRKGRSFRPLRTLTTNHRGVFGLRAKHRKHQRYRVRWTAPGGKVWLGPPIRAVLAEPFARGVRRPGRAPRDPVRDPGRMPRSRRAAGLRGRHGGGRRREQLGPGRVRGQARRAGDVDERVRRGPQPQRRRDQGPRRRGGVDLRPPDLCRAHAAVRVPLQPPSRDERPLLRQRQRAPCPRPRRRPSPSPSRSPTAVADADTVSDTGRRRLRRRRSRVARRRPAGAGSRVRSFRARPTKRRFCTRRSATCPRPGVFLRLALGASDPVRVRGTLRRGSRRVRAVSLRVRPGSRRVRLPGPRLRPGSYALTLRAGDITRRVRFAVRPS